MNRRRVRAGAAVALVALLTACSSSGGPGPASTPATAPVGSGLGPEGIPLEPGQLLAPESSAATGDTVGGVKCESSEQVAYHIHTHLAVYVNGALRPIPPGIGVVAPVAEPTAQGAFYTASRCFYWLHVHAQDGVIHIEAPSSATYTLGQFFAIWQQPLTSTRVATVAGKEAVFVDGRRYVGDPAKIVLKSREDIQIDIGSPEVAPQAVDWAPSGL